MQENIAAPNFTEQDLLVCGIQKARVIPGDSPTAPEKEAQDIVPLAGQSSLEQECQQSSLQPHFFSTRGGKREGCAQVFNAGSDTIGTVPRLALTEPS